MNDVAIEVNKIYHGDSLSVLKTFHDESIDCCITSPPYWGLRDYGVEGQLGNEKHFQEYLDKLTLIFNEVKRILKAEGTCWINLGDTYGTGSGGGNSAKIGDKQLSNKGSLFKRKSINMDKSLCQIPSRFAIAMSDRGWILRNKIIWHKPNCMPSSAKDRFTVDFEEIFFFVKSKKYYFKKQYEPQKEVSYKRCLRAVSNHHKNLNVPGQTTHGLHKARARGEGKDLFNPLGRNKRAVWTITTHSFKEAHFATFPEKLVIPMINAGCPEGGVVLDPFMGAGTTGLVAKKFNRRYVGIELNPEFINIANNRIEEALF